ncbi:MAG: transporter [Opitutales bacterium]
MPLLQATFPFLRPVLPVLLLAATGALRAATDAADYTWSNPKPEGALRELNSDRPDVTEGPFTVDAGHVQLEMDFANLTLNRDQNERSTELGAAPFNLRIGLSDRLEAGLFVVPFIDRHSRPADGSAATVSGAGDTTLRLKYNFWGNDGGESAGGLIVDLKLPTANSGLGNGRTEGTAYLPGAWNLPGDWDLGAMTAVNLAYFGSSYRAGWINTVTLGHPLTRKTAGYIELTSLAGLGAPVATFDFGATWLLSRNLQLDAGANLGISRAAPDFLVFSGVTRRF